MRTIRGIVISWVVFFPHSIVLANPDRVFLDEKALYDECGIFSQAEMRECLAEKAKESHQILEQLEEERYASPSPVDPEYLSESGGKRSVANQAFYLYRDAYCAFDASLGGRTGMTIVYPGCIAVQNNKRAEHLDKIVRNLKKMVDKNLAIPSVLLFDNRGLDKKCGWKGTEGGKADKCLNIETEESFQALKQAEIEIFRAVANWDEHFHYIVAAKGKLALANQVFYLYRDAHCAFEASLTRGEDSTRDTLHSICIAELNDLQTLQLHKLALELKDRGSGKPNLND